MPLYAYECPEGHGFESFFRMTQDSSSAVCPVCERAASKVLLPPRISVENVRYECPVTGKPITSKHQHAENLRVHGCHVLEPGEADAARRVREQTDRELDRVIGESVERQIEQMPTHKVEQLANEMAVSDVTIERTPV